MAIVFIELRPDFRRIVQVRALRNAFPRLPVSFQAAHENSVKLQWLCASLFGSHLLPVLAQANALLLAQGTELVVIVGTERGLTVAH
jgi:hypothetical protein